MYRKHFALTTFPVDLTPEREDLFVSSTLTEAEVRLRHLLELCAIGLVTGKPALARPRSAARSPLPCIRGSIWSSMCRSPPAT